MYKNPQAENIIIPICVSSWKICPKCFCYAFCLFVFPIIITLSDKNNFIAVR